MILYPIFLLTVILDEHSLHQPEALSEDPMKQSTLPLKDGHVM